MKRVMILLGLAGMWLVGCSDSKAAAPTPAPVTVTATPTPTPTVDPVKVESACRDALRADYETGWEKTGNDPYPPAARGAACSGLTRPVIDRLMEEAIDDLMNGTAGPG